MSYPCSSVVPMSCVLSVSTVLNNPVCLTLYIQWKCRQPTDWTTIASYRQHVKQLDRVEIEAANSKNWFLSLNNVEKSFTSLNMHITGKRPSKIANVKKPVRGWLYSHEYLLLQWNKKENENFCNCKWRTETYHTVRTIKLIFTKYRIYTLYGLAEDNVKMRNRF